MGAGIGAEALRDLLARLSDAAVRQGMRRDLPPAPLDVRFEQRSGDPAEELERVAATATAPFIAVGFGLDS